jgi:hypothetical protein
MQKLKTFLTVFGAVTVLVLAANTVAFAATGGKFILGHTNKANKVSTLKRTTSGSALTLITKSSANAPLTTNGRGKVANLNADLLDGLDSSALARSQAPVKVWVAPYDPTRSMAIPGTDTVVKALPITVPAECGANTRHTYLVDATAWWTGTNAIVETSISLDTATQQFGEGSSVATINSYATTASSRKLVLAPGSHTVRLMADQFSGTGLTSFDPALRATDLGYSCAGGAVSRIAPGTTGSGAGGR